VRQIYDLIIVGSGAAGLTAALETGDNRVLVVTKTGSFSSGSSPLAQGGIAASVGNDDSPELHKMDTVVAGVYSGLLDQISFLTKNGALAIDKLVNINMAFDKTSSGLLERNHEGAHSRRRVLKAGGDATGKILVETLYNEALKRENIDWECNLFVYNLVISDNKIQGIIGFSKENGWVFVKSPRVLLATGGVGQLFGHTTNPPESTGDSIAIAIRSGLALKDIEMVQFHPTALNVKNGDSLMLLTEALRGAGARLVRDDGALFMGKYSPLKELAPRDVVSRSIWKEISNGHNVFLDLKPIENIDIKFPTVTSFCLKAGLNPRRDLIPVTPAVHYIMGGIDINSELPKGLGVAGEAAFTGVHGANRLASNSLLECLVYGKSEVEKLLMEYHDVLEIDIDFPLLNSIPDAEDIKKVKSELQSVMYKYCGIIRSEVSLNRALEEINKIEDNVKKLSGESSVDFSRVVSWLELNNMILLGRELTMAALARTESRGAHFRVDYPETSIKWDRIKIKRGKDDTTQDTV